MSENSQVCPKCQSTDVAEIIYGWLDSMEKMVEVSKNRHVHPICYFDDENSPQYYCNKCYHKFGQSNKRELYSALRSGDVEKVRTLMKQGIKMPSLFRPIYGGNKTALKTLILAGADVNTTAKGDKTPLHYICGAEKEDGGVIIEICTMCGDAEIAQMLINAGANLNARDENGYTPLHLAAQRGFKKIFDLLVKAGADSSLKVRRKVSENGSPAFLSKTYKEHLASEMWNERKDSGIPTDRMDPLLPTEYSPIGNSTTKEKRG